MKKLPQRKIIRWQGYDYSGAGMYFITICTHLNTLGKYVVQKWLETPAIRTDINITLDEFVVMTNHFHGILVFGQNRFNIPAGGHIAGGGNKFGPQSKNLAAVIRGFKGSVTSYARDHQIPFGWQSRYHDHVIRNHVEYERIAQYIINNPLNWHDDVFHTP